MKGLTHFLTGVCVSSFFGSAVEMAEFQQSLILALGGVFGLLPDTLDFKFGAFFTREDHYIDPDPLKPDPRKMARQIGRAAEEAYDKNRMVKIKCHTIRLGADLWRQYIVKFDSRNNEIVVVINPIVTMSQIPYLGTEPRENRVGRYKLKMPLVETHGKPTVVDIMSGPEVGFKRIGDKVVVEFIPYHRTWSHSYFVGALAASLVWVLASLCAGWSAGWYYALIAFVAYCAHITEDLTGYIGASLFWPFRKGRTRGMSWFKAQNPTSNFIFNYCCVMITVFNLNRFTFVDRVNRMGHFIGASPLKYFLYTIFIPVGIYAALVKLFGKKEKEKKEEAAELAEHAIEDECGEEVSAEFA